MAFVFSELISEVKRRAIRNQAGTEYDVEIPNVINTSLLRIAREARWRPLRRTSYFTTVSSYTSGTNLVTVTNSSTAVSLSATACDFWVDNIAVNRQVKFGTNSWDYTIRAINSNTNLVIDMPYKGTTSTGTTYEIYPQAEYNLPVQVDHRAFLWHEDYGYPFLMFYIPDQEFFGIGATRTVKATPTHYRMWGEDTVISQVPTATPLMISSSTNTDTTVQITVFGKISGYPYFETVTLAGTTATKTAYEFENVERISKNSASIGKITVTSSRGNYTVAVLPAGSITDTIKYSKVQIYPIPLRNFPINVYYYKDPYKLVNNNDVHELGQEFDEAIILLSVAKIKSQEGQAEAALWLQMYQDEIKNLKQTNIDKIDWTPILKRPNQGRTDPYVTRSLLFRQVGPYFGPSSRR